MAVYTKIITASAVITIATSTTVSAAVDLGANTITGIQMPAAFTGTALTFQVSSDGSTYVPLYDASSTQYSMPVGPSRGYSIDPAVFAGWPYVKVVSGTTEVANRTITLLVRPV